MQAHVGFVRALAFTDVRLVSAGEDGKVKIWTAAPGKHWKPVLDKEPLTLNAHPGGALALAITPGGGSVVSSGRNGTIMVWDVANGQPRAVLAGHKSAVTGLAVHPRGEHLISGSAEAELFRWRSSAAKGGIVEAPPNAENPAAPIGTPAPPPNDGVAGNAAPSGRGLLIALILCGLTLMAMIAAGVGYLIFARKSQPSSSQTADDSKRPREASFAFIVVQCSACARKLKVKSSSAGKKVKCLCGAAVQVPNSRSKSD